MSAALLMAAVEGAGHASTLPSPPPHQARDAEWVARIRNGDEAAFEALFRAYVASLVRFTESYIGDAALAQEIVDDVLWSVWQRHHAWDPAQGAAAYLFASVRHRALNMLRDERRRSARADAFRQHADLTGSYEASANDDVSSDVDDIDRVLAPLPSQRRRVMALRWKHELTPEEIAEALGMSRNAVYLALSRSLETLRKLFAGDVR